MTVRSLAMLSIVFSTVSSLLISSALVGSSRIKILGSCTKARAIAICCFSPAVSLRPPGPIFVR